MHLPAGTRGANKHSTRAAHRLQHMHPFNLARQRCASPQATVSRRKSIQEPLQAIDRRQQSSRTRRQVSLTSDAGAFLRRRPPQPSTKRGHFSRTSNAAPRLPQRKRAAHVLRL